MRGGAAARWTQGRGPQCALGPGVSSSPPLFFILLSVQFGGIFLSWNIISSLVCFSPLSSKRPQWKRACVYLHQTGQAGRGDGGAARVPQPGPRAFPRLPGELWASLLARASPGTRWIGILHFAEPAKDSGGSYLTGGGRGWNLPAVFFCFVLFGEERTETAEPHSPVSRSLQADAAGFANTCYSPGSRGSARAAPSAPREGSAWLPGGLGRTRFSWKCSLFILLQAECFWMSFRFLRLPFGVIKVTFLLQENVSLVWREAIGAPRHRAQGGKHQIFVLLGLR